MVDHGFGRDLVSLELNRWDEEIRSAFLYALGGGSTSCDEVRRLAVNVPAKLHGFRRSRG